MFNETRALHSYTNVLKDIVYMQCNIILQETGAALFKYYLMLKMLHNNNYYI